MAALRSAFCFAAQATLVFCQLRGVLAEGVDRIKHRAIRERSKQRNACIEVNKGRRWMHRLCNLDMDEFHEWWTMRQPTHTGGNIVALS
ncbi:MAG TPA: hypothetical protein VMV40_10420 [Acidiferrobacter sp.]|nr:hypothetical protein [Acidiferrobacter sp.]